MRTITVSIILLGLVSVLSGCGTAIKEGVGIARGAKGVYAPIQPIAASAEARPLGAYRRFELGTIADDFGGKTPSQFLPLLRQAFAEQLADSDLPNSPGGKTLLIRGKILHYESEDLLGVAVGPLEQVVVRAELVDKDTGQVLGTANCIGRTTERVNLGVAKKADGLAKAFISWIESRYPLP